MAIQCNIKSRITAFAFIKSSIYSLLNIDSRVEVRYNVKSTIGIELSLTSRQEPRIL